MLPVKAHDQINMVMKEPEPKFLFPGIPEGSMGLIAGAPKTGKTTFAENLSISLSVGRNSFFGKPLIGRPVKVLYINLEESYKLRSRRMGNQIKVLTEDELKLFAQNYYTTPEKFPSFINSTTDWEMLRDYISACKPQVLILDSLSHLLVGKIEESQSVQKFFQNFFKYIRLPELTIMVVHHCVKGNDRPMDQDSIAGSRFVLQEYEFAIGLANIPTAQGGNYACMVFNKHVEKNDSEALLYKINANGWVDYIGESNKYALYRETKVDGRSNTLNKKRILDLFNQENGKGSKSSTIPTSKFKNDLIDTGIMSKQTFHLQMNELLKDGLVESPERGNYRLISKKTEQDNNKLSGERIKLLEQYASC